MSTIAQQQTLPLIAGDLHDLEMMPDDELLIRAAKLCGGGLEMRAMLFALYDCRAPKKLPGGDRVSEDGYVRATAAEMATWLGWLDCSERKARITLSLARSAGLVVTREYCGRLSYAVDRSAVVRLVKPMLDVANRTAVIVMRRPRPIGEDNTACREDGTACREDGTACREDGTACREDGTACREDGTACREDGTACREDAITGYGSPEESDPRTGAGASTEGTDDQSTTSSVDWPAAAAIIVGLWLRLWGQPCPDSTIGYIMPPDRRPKRHERAELLRLAAVAIHDDALDVLEAVCEHSRRTSTKPGGLLGHVKSSFARRLGYGDNPRPLYARLDVLRPPADLIAVPEPARPARAAAAGSPEETRSVLAEAMARMRADRRPEAAPDGEQVRRE